MLSTALIRLSAVIVLAQSQVFAQSNNTEYFNLPIRYNTSGPFKARDGLFVNCTNCYIQGDLSFSGGAANTTPPSNYSDLPFDFSQKWAAVVMEDFTAHFEVGFFSTGVQDYTQTEHGLIPGLVPGLSEGITFHTGAFLLGISWTFDAAIHSWITANSSVNFTYGFDFTVPRNSAIFVPLEGNKSTETTGFNRSTITPLNYTSPDPNEDFRFGISFRPDFTIGLEVAYLFDLTSFEVFADLPKLDVSVKQVYNATSDCKPAPAGTHSDQIYSSLTQVIPTLGYDVGDEWDIIGIDALNYTWSIGTDKTLPASCLMYSEKDHGLIAARAVKNKAGRDGVKGQILLVWMAMLLLVHAW